jgi:hypothetical protein
VPDRTDEHNHRYHAAAHAMQTGVKAVAHYEPSETTPASLRIGVNAAHVSVAALTQLLLDRGIFTMEDYAAANADQMETEAEAYRQRLQTHLGGDTEVTLA